MASIIKRKKSYSVVYSYTDENGEVMECSFSAFCENLGKSKWEYEDIFKVEQNDQTIWYYTELTDNDS